MAEAMGDAQYTALLGAKCPECGWRSTAERPNHRPPSGAFEACPHRTLPTGDSAGVADDVGVAGDAPEAGEAAR